MATKVTYISTSLPSDEQNAAFDAAVAEVRQRVGTHQLLIGGTARAGRCRHVLRREPGESRRVARHLRRGVGGRRRRRRRRRPGRRARLERHALCGARAHPAARRRADPRARHVPRRRRRAGGRQEPRRVGGRGRGGRRPDLVLLRPAGRAPRVPHRPGVADRRGPQHVGAAPVRRVRRHLALQLPVRARRRARSARRSSRATPSSSSRPRRRRGRACCWPRSCTRRACPAAR